jgi:hypothetical protein
VNFKPVQILRDMVDVKSSTPHTPAHDIESLIWVAIYSIYRHAYARAQDPCSNIGENDREMIIEAFRGDFGDGMSLPALHRNRRYMSIGALSNLSLMYPRLQDGLGEFITGMLMLVGKQNGEPWPTDHVLRAYLGDLADDSNPVSAGHLKRFVLAWKAANWDRKLAE